MKYDAVQIINGYFSRRMSVLLTLFIMFTALAYGAAGTFKQYFTGSDKRIVLTIKDKDIGIQEAISAKQVKNLHESSYKNGVSFLNCEYSAVSAEKISAKANICLTDDNYCSFWSRELIQGSFISESAYNEGRKVAVISDKFAVDLFGTTDALKNQVDIFGESYKIIGVFAEHTSLISLLSTDGINDVFVPFTSMKEGGDKPVETLFLKDGEFEEDDLLSYQIRSELDKDFKINSNNYNVFDYYTYQMDNYTLLPVLQFIIGIIVAVLLIKFTMFYMIRFKLALREELKTCYLFDAIKNNRYKYMKLIVMCFLPAAVMLAVLYITKPHIKIPPEYIPADNIFDFRFYWDIVNNRMIQNNIKGAYTLGEFEVYYKNTAICINLFTAVAAIILLQIISSIRVIKAVERPNVLVLKIVAISTLSIPVTIFIFGISGFAFAIPFREIGLLYAALLLKGALYRRRNNDAALLDDGLGSCQIFHAN